MSNPTAKSLYNALINKGYTSANIGDEETFVSAMADKANRKELFDMVVNDGYDLGDYDAFEGRFTPQPTNVEQPKPSVDSLNVEQPMAQVPEPMKSDTIQPVQPIAQPTIVAQNESQTNGDYAIGLKQGLEQGWKGLKEGARYFVGETANVFTGSSEDEQRAIEAISRLEEEGVNIADYAQPLSKSLERVYKRGIASSGDNISTLTDIEQEQVRAILEENEIKKTIADAIKEAGGDLDKAKQLLSRAATPTWGDRIKADAADEMSKMKPTKGFGAWVGNLIPQMIPSAAAMTLSAVTKNPKYAKLIGHLGMGTMTASTAGQSMKEARDAGASGSEVWAVGIADGIIEYATEKIPFDRYTTRLFNGTKRKVGQELANAVVDNNSPARNELEKLLTEANKKLGGKLLNGKTVKDYATDVLAEGASEFTAEALQTITPMIYENPEDYPTITEILQNGWEGAKAGLFMGSVLGGASKIAEHQQQRSRRQQQGFVDVAQVQVKDDGTAEVGEVIGVNNENGNLSLLIDGKVQEFTPESVKERHRFTFEEFDKGVVQMEQDESFDNGAALETPQEKNDAQNMFEYQQQQMRQYFGLGEDGDVDAFLGDDPIAGLQRVSANDQEAGQVVLDYLNAKATVDGVFQRMSDDAEAKIAEADAIIASRTNRNNGLIQRVRLKNDKQAYVLSGDIVMTDDGDMVNVSKSSESLVVIDAITGKKEYTYPSNIAEVYQSVDAETERQTLREQVIDEYSQKLADDMNGTLAFAPGDNYTLVDDQGAQHNVQIVTDNGDGTVAVVEVMPDGVQQEAVMAKSTIQEMSGTYNQLRLGQYLQDKKAQEIAIAEQEAQAEQPEVVAEEQQQPVSALSQVPKDKKGKHDFNRVSPDIAWNAIVEMTGGAVDDALDTAKQMQKQSNDALKAAQKEKPKVGTDVESIIANKNAHKEKINGLQAIADHWVNIVALGEQSAQQNEQTEEVVAENVVAEETTPVAEQTEVAPEVAPVAEEVVEPTTEEQAVEQVLATQIIPEISLDERIEMQKRIIDWLSEDNLKKAEGKTRAEILEIFGNTPMPIAYITSDNLSYVSKDAKDPRIYCGKGYFIDHALRNHSNQDTQISAEDVDVSKYLNMQSVLNDPDSLKETFVDGKRTVVFVKKIGRYFAELTQFEENGKIVLHKSLFSQKKEPYAKLKDIRQKETSSEGGVSSISRTEESSAPAISLESRGDVISESKDTTTEPITQEVEQENLQEEQNAAIRAAEAEVNINPTEKQKEAGNYKKGHVQIGTFKVTIEQPKGSVRSGVDKDGKKWEVEMQNTYGYIRGTEGVDGDHIDVFLSDDIDGWNGRQVFVVDQRNEDGTFDEHKVMLGFNDINDAEAAYLSNYEEGWQGLGAITDVPIEDFEKWITSSHRKTKAFAEYKSVKTTEGQSVSKAKEQVTEQTAESQPQSAVEPEWLQKVPNDGRNFMVYTKAPNENSYSATNLANGQSVSNLAYASLVKRERLQGLVDELPKVLMDGFHFQIRDTKGNIYYSSEPIETTKGKKKATTKMTTLKTVSGAEVKVPINLYKYVSADKTRAYTGVYFDPAGFVVATNGSNMIAIKHDVAEADAEKFISKAGDVASTIFNWRVATLKPNTEKLITLDFSEIENQIGGKSGDKFVLLEIDGKEIDFGPKAIHVLADFQRAFGGKVFIGDMTAGKAIEIRSGDNYAIALQASHYASTTWSVRVSVNTEQTTEQVEQPTAVSEQAQQPTEPTKQEPKPKRTADRKIEDYGEKIAGARKDILRNMSKNFDNATIESLVALPFAKAFVKPDLKKLVEAGVLRPDDAKYAEAIMWVYINKNKPKARKTDVWAAKRGRETRITAWAKKTFDGITRLRDFIEADEATRDELIAQYGQLGEQIKANEDIDRVRLNRLNGGALVFGDLYSPNPIEVIVAALDKLNYQAGDKITFDAPIVKAEYLGRFYNFENQDGEKVYAFSRANSIEEAIDTLVLQAKIRRGDTDIQYPTDMFSITREDPIREPSGMFTVFHINKRGSLIPETVEGREAAEKKVAEYQSQGLSADLREEKKIVGYATHRIRFKNRLTDVETIFDEKFGSEGEARQALEERYDEFNDLANDYVASLSKQKREQPVPFEVTTSWNSETKAVKYVVKNTETGDVMSPQLDTRKEAEEYYKNHIEEWKAKWQEMKDARKKFVFFDDNVKPREGKDYRNGRDVTAEDLATTFGFRGIQFGNWTNDADRQAALNQAYDAFMDLADILGVSPKALSLAGELGIAFGARGGGSALAHYEPDEIVINLTKTKGAGSLAHEWWHALDNYFSRQGNIPMGFVTSNPAEAKMREEMRAAWQGVVKAVKGTEYAKRSMAQGDYWGRMLEMTARLFGEWTVYELAKTGRTNHFLSRGITPGRFDMWRRINYAAYKWSLPEDQTPMSFEEFALLPRSLKGMPFPTKEETEQMGEAVRNLFDVVQEKVDEQGNVVLFQRGDLPEMPNTEANRRAYNLVREKLQNAGIKVHEVSEEMMQQMAEAADAEYQIVYHGSGAKFDRFDHSFMGTGEGAQAYGYGTYVTQVEGIGKTYAKSVRNSSLSLSYKGVKVDTEGHYNPWRIILDMYNDSRGKLRDMRAKAERYESLAEDDSQMKPVWKEVVRILKDDVRAGDLAVAPTRVLYSVEIPDSNGEYLQWDGEVADDVVDRLRDELIEEYGEDVAFAANLKYGQTGQHLYQKIERALGSGKAVSEFLNRNGFVGIEYPAQYRSGGRADNAKNYVIFNENDLKIVDRVELFQDAEGKIYGWAVGGEIYLTPDGLNANTAIHEYSHLWVEAMRKKDPRKWSEIKEQLKDTPFWQQVLDDPNYENIRENEEAVASEVLARLSGNKGAERLANEAQRIIDAGNGNLMARVESSALVQHVKRLLRDFYAWVSRNIFGVTNEATISQFSDMVVDDLLDEVALDNIEGSPYEAMVGVSEDTRFRITPAMDKAYMDAVERGDMDEAQKMVNVVASAAGYSNDESWKKSHRAPRKSEDDVNPFNTEELVPDDYWTHPEWYTNMRNSADRESYYNMVNAIRKYKRLVADGKQEEADKVTVTMYRGVDKTANKREGSFRNGDWITPSRSYAKMSAPYGKSRVIEQEVPLKYIWWDGNSINEWGYDDGANYTYKDTKNNRKLLDAVTYDDNGNVIPLSQRFNSRESDIRFRSSDRAEVIANFDADFAELDSEYQQIDKNDEQAMAEWRAKKKRVVEDYLNYMTDDLALPASVFIYDHNDKGSLDEAVRLIAEVVADKLGENVEELYLPDHKKDLDEFTDAIAAFTEVGRIINGRGMYNVGRAVDNNEPLSWFGAVVHENAHHLLEGKHTEQEFADIWNEAVENEAPIVPKIQEHYATETNATKGEEVVAFAVGGYAGSKHTHIFASYIKGDGEVSLDDIVKKLNKSLPLRNELVIEVLNNLRNEYQRQETEVNTDRGDQEANREREAARQGQESGERSSRRDSQAAGQPRRDLNAIATAAEELAGQLHTPIRIVRDVAEITDDNRTTQARKRAAKGWYDINSDEVIVILPNAESEQDVIETVLHEAVAHRGLRNVVGNEAFDTFLDNVFHNANPETRAKIVNIASRNGWEFRLATEEYIASLAERGFNERENRGFWEMVRDFFRDMLSKAKIALGFNINDNDLRYMLWRSYQMQNSKGAMAVAENVDMQRKLGVGNFRTRQGALQKANGQFNRELQEYIENGAKPNTMFHIGMPQGVMQNFLPNLPIVMRPRILNKASRTKHNVEVSALRNLPSMISEPIFVFNREDGKLGVLTEIKDRDGKNVCIAIEMNKTIQDGKSYLEVNDIITIHGREVLNIIQPIVYNNTLRYVDKKKGLDWLSSASYNYQQEIDSKDLDSATKIVEDFDNSKYKASKNMPDNIRFREGSDMIADDIDYDAGSMTFEESITNGLIKLAQERKDNAELKMNAIRAIGGNLSKLRKAMTAQRKYDQAMVDSIIRIAKMAMNSGFFTDMSRAEVSRLLTLVNKAASSRDITNQARDVVDMLIKHQVKEAKTVFEKLLKVRGAKVDSRGIIVQGKLDSDGQRMVAAFKEGIKLDPDTLQERIDQVLDEMGSDDSTIAANASVKYQGLMLAQQYVNEIRQSEIEEAEIKRELQEVTEAKILERDDYAEFVESVEDAIRENRLERIEAYNRMIIAMGEGMNYSIARAKKWREEQKERVQQIHHDANSDLQGVPTDEHSQLTWKQKIANNGLLRFAMQPLANFDQMLRFFGSKNVDGRGYLWNRFMSGFTAATDKEWKNKQAAQNELSEKLSKIMGKKMRITDVFSMMRKMPTVSVQFWDSDARDNSKREDKDKKTYELTQGNLLYIYMVNKMSDGRMKLRKMGISEQDVANITKLIDPRFIEFADWLQNDYLVRKRNEYNEVHQRMFGASMAAIENYFPLVINSRSRNVAEKIEEQKDDNARPSTITGSIIKRVRNSVALDLTNADAFAVILDHVDQMERWAAFAEFNRDLNALLSYKRFRNRVLNMSSARFGAGTTLWKNFKDTCAIAAGVYRPKGGSAIDATVLNLAKGVTASKIAFRLWTAVKQVLSVPAFATETNTWEFIKAFNPTNMADSWNWAIEELPTFAKRWQSRQAGDSRLRKTDLDWGFTHTKILETVTRIGMSPNAFVDALACVVGAKAIYETKYKRYLKQGYNEAQAKQKALDDASVAFNETQQSSEDAYLSAMQVDRTVASVALSVFRNSNMAYTRRLMHALSNLKRRLKEGYNEESIAFMAKQMMREGGLTKTQANANATKAYNQQGYKDIADVVLFGIGLKLMWELGSYLPYLIMGDDDEEKKQIIEDALVRSIAGPIEGLAGGDIVADAIGWKLSGKGFYGYSFGSLPLMDDIQNTLSKFDSDKVAAINDVLNILVASTTGVNLQTLTDTAVAIIDAVDADPATSKEVAMLIMRIMQVPQSQIDEIYIDELGMNAREARDLNPDALAHRYAEYKRKKAAPITGIFYDKEGKEKADEKYVKRFNKMRKERIENAGDPHARKIIEEYENDELLDTEALSKEINAQRKESESEYFNRYNRFRVTPEYSRYQIYKQKQKEIDKAIKEFDWHRVDQLRTALADELSKSYALQTNEDASK